MKAVALAVLTAFYLVGGSAMADIGRASLSAATGAKVDRVLVEKGERRLSLFSRGNEIASYPIALGRNPVGPKVFQGDGRTPEGTYRISARNTQSQFYRSLRINYPSRDDVALAARYGIPAGGDIMIHGQPNGGRRHDRKDWTEGCIAVSNTHMDEIWRAVDTGTVVEIRP